MSNERPHCHEPSITMVIRTEFISRVKHNNINEKPSDVICAALPSLPDDFRGTITNLDHTKKQIRCYRNKFRGYTSAAIASAATTPIPTTLCATGRRFLLSDLYTSRNKRINTCSLHGDPRTNNYAEGGNNAINNSMGVSNLTIYKFTENLQLYNCEAETQLLQVDSRPKNPRRPTRNSDSDNKAAIQAIVAGYDVNDRVAYCRSLGYWDS